ncbi:alpha/beta-Hydrolases superfamily protein [Trifolium repens]|nr:alpha/beta-Hydrolases superfamily protein [Trifolium repens]
MIDQFINFVIRPPRVEYDPDQYLWEKEFILAGREYQRKDLELKNARGYTLQCSHYLPSSVPEDISLPCVIYCHGNSGCRADANEAAVILLPSNITVFTLDFSGSGLSDGDHVSLGWHEKEDLKMVVSYLRSDKQVSRIGLWGRSMGAVTSLLYGAEDPSIAGMVLDSAFSNLYDLMLELVDVYKIRLPKFTVKMVVQYMRRVIEKKAKFDIMDLNCLQVAPKTFIPVLFGHGNDDEFVQPHHSDLIFESYAGDKNIIKFDGDHNSTRPQIFFDSVCIFFYNVLRPPRIPRGRRFEKYYSLRDTKIGSVVNEGLLYDLISNIRTSTTDAASSSSGLPTIASESMIRDMAYGYREPTDSKDEQNFPGEDFFSYCSSTRESWGDDIDSEVFATPMGSMREQLAEPKEDKKNQKKKAETVAKKLKPDKFERLESFSRRLRLCILKGSCHRRHQSS